MDKIYAKIIRSIGIYFFSFLFFIFSLAVCIFISFVRLLFSFIFSFFCLVMHIWVVFFTSLMHTHIIYTWLRFFIYCTVCLFSGFLCLYNFKHIRIDEATIGTQLQVCEFVCAYMQYLWYADLIIRSLAYTHTHTFSFEFPICFAVRFFYFQCAFLLLFRFASFFCICVRMHVCVYASLCAFLFNDDYSLVILAMCI